MNIYYDDMLDRVFTQDEIEILLGHQMSDLTDEQQLRYVDYANAEFRSKQDDVSAEALLDAGRIMNLISSLEYEGHLLEFPIWNKLDDKIYFEEDIDALLQSMQWRVDSSPFRLQKREHLYEKLRLVELVAWGHVADAATLAEWVVEASFPSPDAAGLMHHGELIRRLGEAIQEREEEHAN